MAETLVTERGHIFLLLPKFHCELNPIELVWCMAKNKARENCGYNIGSLRIEVDKALAHVKGENIQRFFRKAEDFIQAYREGEDGEGVEKRVKEIKKSHRRVNLPNENV